MKRSPLLALVLCLVAGTPIPAFAQTSKRDAALETLLNRLSQDYEKLVSAEIAATKSLDTNLLKELQKLRDSFQSKGELQSVLELDAALQALKGGGSRFVLYKSKLSSVEQLRSNYEKSRLQALKTSEPMRARLEVDFSRSLSDLQLRYTRAGQLEDAKAAQQARLDAPPGIAVDILPLFSGPKESRGGLTTMKPEGRIATTATFQPPLEIQYVLKTDKQVRLGYACDQLIFNWEVNPSELRIDGGPVSGQHRQGSGTIPRNQLVTIRQVVVPDQMTVFVDGKERAKWNANFSEVNSPIAVQSNFNSAVALQQITIKKLR